MYIPSSTFISPRLQRCCADARKKKKHLRGVFFAAIRACGGNGSVRARCHILCLQCFPVWPSWCPQLLMVSQRWVVCDAHPAQPPLTDPRGDNWLLSSISHLAFQMALWDSQAVVAAATWLLLSQNTPTKRQRKRLFFLLLLLLLPLWLPS